jgi:transcriptional regulator with XRE-family HTH domain
MKDEMLFLVSKRVRDIRTQKKITQEKLALNVGLDLSYYNHFENGKKNISLKNLLKISIALDVEPFEIMPSKTELLSKISEQNE